MAKHSDSKAPKMRFSGFSEDWIKRPFNLITSRTSQYCCEENLPRLEYEDIISESGQLNKDLSKKKSNKKGIKFEKEDVLFGKLRPYLKNWLLAPFDGIAVGDFWVLKPSETVPSFLYRLIQTKMFEVIANQSAGSKMPRSDWNLVSNSFFYISASLLEQKKVGFYFNQLDEIIAQYQHRCDKLATLKKSMLQKMFPQDGSTVPEIRFKGFTSDWAEKKLEDIIALCSGRDYKHLSSGNIPVYGTGGYMLSVNKALSYDKDAIGIGRKGTIDKPYLLRCPFWTVDTLFYAVPREEFELNFTYCIFQKIDWKNKDESTGVPSLSKSAINEIQVIVPLQNEQQKIGAYFRKLDELISQHATQLEKLKQIKSACLAKMFV
ncbi:MULTISPECIES: restriction endonuclease subunit S [Pectobacterium]|uniref:Restriction endonuclease subunit S n=1 Tax=Pectobacterium parvum TaxID=2778550 RepID=A0ABW8FU78_9GAMM|nr:MULTISPECIES: restriction endonuclease subunit S [Pectobacterium]